MQLINLEAENSLLSCMLKDNSLIKETQVQTKHFHDVANKTVFDALKKLDSKNEPIDIVTIITEIRPENLNKIGGTQKLTMLESFSANVENYKTYENYIIEAWKVREAKRLQETEISSLEDIRSLQEKLAELDEDTTEEEYDHKETLIQLHRDIEKQQDGLSGYDTGYNDLNAYLDGFQEGNLIIIAARPSVGKTAFMLNLSEKHTSKGGISLIHSLEMSKEELLKRKLSSIGNIDGHKMRNPKTYFNDDDWTRYSNALAILGDMNLHIYDKSGQTISYIRSKVRQLRRKYPDEQILVMIDYLQLIRTEKRYESKNIEVGEITRSLKELAKDEKVPIVLLSQLSRAVTTRQDKRPMMSDIRDSGSVEQDADVIMFLHRDDYYNKESDKQNITEVIIAKQRNGPVGTIEMYYQREFNKFVELEKRYENQRSVQKSG